MFRLIALAKLSVSSLASIVVVVIITMFQLDVNTNETIKILGGGGIAVVILYYVIQLVKVVKQKEKPTDISVIFMQTIDRLSTSISHITSAMASDHIRMLEHDKDILSRLEAITIVLDRITIMLDRLERKGL